MTQRPDQLSLSLGADAEARRLALQKLAADTDAIGRNNTPSISEMVARLADAAIYHPAETAELMRRLFVLAADPIVRDATGNIVAVRLTADGRPLGLAGAAAANPQEFAAFVDWSRVLEDEEE